MIHSKGRKSKIRNKKSKADYSELPWRELVALASARGLYKIGMKKADVLAAL